MGGPLRLFFSIFFLVKVNYVLQIITSDIVYSLFIMSTLCNKTPLTHIMAAATASLILIEAVDIALVEDSGFWCVGDLHAAIV